MQKVALVSTHQGSEGNRFLEPVSLLWLAAFLQVRGVDVSVIVGTATEVMEALQRYRPDVVGMSSYYNSGYESLGRLIRQQRPETVIAVGGPDITGRLIEGELNDGTVFDTWFAGHSFKAFSDQLNQTSWPRVVIGGSDEPPIGEWPKALRIPELINNSDFRGRPSGRGSLNRGWAFLSSSVGCPHSCLFCLNPAINNCRVQFRDPAEVAAEARELVDIGAGLLYMTDEDVAPNLDHLSWLCDELRKAGLSDKVGILAGVHIRSMLQGSSQDLRDILNNMRAAGFVQLGAGVEGPENVRSYLKGGKEYPSNAQIRSWSKACDETGIRTLGFTLAGPWWRTEAEMAKDIEEMCSLELDGLSCNELLAFPGTACFRGLTVHGRTILADRKTLKFHSPIPEMAVKARKLIEAYGENPNHLRRIVAKAARWPKLM